MQRTRAGNNTMQLFSQLSHLLLMALFAFPVLPLQATNILFILFSSVVLLYWIYIKPVPLWKSIRFNALLLLPFVPYLAELLLHPQSATMAFECQKKIPFFIAPFSIPVFLRLTGRNDVKPYFRCFSVAMILLAVYVTAMLLYSGSFSGSAAYANGDYLLRSRFELYSHLHPTYYGLFSAAAICWILYAFEYFSLKEKFLYATGALLLLLLSLLVAARMPLLILFGGLFFVLYLNVKDRKKLALSYAALLALIALLYLVLPPVKSRFGELHDAASAGNTIQQRQLIFDCSRTVFADHFLSGSGARHAQQVLDQCYKSKDAAMESYKYNAHNQYLTLGINYGIFDILVFLFAIAVLLKHSRNNPFGLFIFAALLLVMLTESILERQMGVYFFLLFTLSAANAGSRESAGQRTMRA